MLDRCLVVGHTDGHGAVATAISIKNLKKECRRVDHIARFPDTGVIPKFWKETINKIKETANKYDKIVFVDIPLDRFDYEGSAKALAEVCRTTDTHFIDHHETPPEIVDFLRSAGCKVKIADSAYDTVYGKPDEKWCVIGAISDRDPTGIRDKINSRYMDLADGLDVLVRSDLEKAIDSILKDDESVFLEHAKKVPDPVDVEIQGDVVIVKDEVPEGWKFKVLDKACRKTGASYGIYLSENKPDRTTGEPRDFVTVIKYWLSKKPSVKSMLPKDLAENAVGHPNAITISAEVGRGKTILERIKKILNIL